jgi:hypothetical protein
MSSILAFTLVATVTVSPCELIRMAEESRADVRLRAVYASSWEGAVLYDPACADGDAVLDVACDPEADTKSCTRGFDELARGLGQEKAGGRAWVVMEGGLAPWNGYGYGNLGGARYRFQVRRVSSVEAFDSRQPWPSPKESGFMLAVKAIRDADLALVERLARGERASQVVSGFQFVLGGDEQVKEPAPLCPRGRLSIAQRVFPVASLAFVQVTVGCTTEEVHREYEYGIVYVHEKGAWVPRLGGASRLQ